MSKRILNPTFIVLMVILILLTGCSNVAGQPAARPAITDPPEDEGSALLLYVLSSNQESSGFKASSDIGIPITFLVDPGNPKGITPIKGKNLADYYVRMGALDGGVMCYTEYTYLVEYVVDGFYNPFPKCDFDVKLTANIVDEEVVRSGNCSIPLQDMFTDAALFVWHVPPPPGSYNIPGSLPVVFMRKDDETKISIELRNVVVPKSSECFFGFLDTPIPSDGE